VSEGTASPTTAGNYFVSNYPPYSFWGPDQIPSAEAALQRAAGKGVPLGLYVHIPFCRKRCDFCYFKVYTEKSGSEVKRYVDAVIHELELYARHPFLAGRAPSFVYFGGGTPSYLSTQEITRLLEGLQAVLPWDGVQEVAFECEPGTLLEGKSRRLRELGVTRLSLGIESFDPELLKRNNRAHLGEEIHRAYGFARSEGFEQINVDLIAGMVGETEATWRDSVEQTVALDAESVTIYQMEVPFNTTLYAQMKDAGASAAPVADWETKRRWVGQAWTAFEAAGYTLSSAYTAKKRDDVSFLYRDALWHGADMLGIGVSSFSQVGGVHFQNEHSLEPYHQRIDAGELPIHRAYELDREELAIREFILQLKLGELDAGYFREKFSLDPLTRWSGILGEQVDAGFIELEGDTIKTTSAGLLRVDQLLHDFFLPRHKGARYA